MNFLFEKKKKKNKEKNDQDGCVKDQVEKSTLDTILIQDQLTNRQRQEEENSYLLHSYSDDDLYGSGDDSDDDSDDDPLTLLLSSNRNRVFSERNQRNIETERYLRERILNTERQLRRNNFTGGQSQFVQLQIENDLHRLERIIRENNSYARRNANNTRRPYGRLGSRYLSHPRSRSPSPTRIQQRRNINDSTWFEQIWLGGLFSRNVFTNRPNMINYGQNQNRYFNNSFDFVRN
eukprot:Anaeramoba_flamelloidesc39627_g1_i1.p1 GENE.c39627_g1_i1~~c39627_g1_i1.p1  ORF type:complete len:262 (+),score=51.73 c39627_g1_i1:82-786(+)